MKQKKKINNKMKNNLKVTPLGGVVDLNRNCYVVEYGKKILVLDMGISFPDDTLPGVDYLIPDIKYLRKRKDRIAGIFLSHAHLDHIGAIPYVIEQLNYPKVYGREFTLELLREILKEHNLDKKVSLNLVSSDSSVDLGNISVRFVPVTHSTPQSSCLLVTTPGGKVFYSGDYKFDDNPVNEPKSAYDSLKKVGKSGVDLALFDSTNVYIEGKSKSETEISESLEKIIKRSRGRVITATFSSLGTRIYSLIEIAKKYGRKVVVTGRSVKTMMNILKRIGYLKFDDKLVLSDKKINSIPDDKVLVISTGSQGEDMAALSRMARGEHQNIKIKEGDTVILSSSVIPGNQIPVQSLIDDLWRLGARVFHQSFMDVHTSGHGHQEDIKRMYQMIKPKNAMPVHGYPSFIHEMAYLLRKWGMKRDRILIPEVGQTYYLDNQNNQWKKGEETKCEDIYVEGGKVIEAGSDIFVERNKLANEGFVSAIVIVNNKLAITAEPRLIYKGFPVLESNKSLRNEVINAIRDQFKSRKKGKVSIDRKNIARSSENILKRILRKSTGKEPLVHVEVITC